MSHQVNKDLNKDILLDLSKKRVAKVILNRPDLLNAFNLNLIHELVRTLKNLDSDKTIDIICITGAGRAFSAGGDLNAMQSKTDMFEGDIARLREIYRRGIQEIPKTIDSIDKPIIALVNGPAVGAGCDLSCMCDLRLVSDRAFFKESFINLSLVSGDGGSFFLQKLIGYGRSMEMLLTGRKLASDEALSIGLATRVFKSTEFEENCDQFIDHLASLPQQALRMNKLGLKNATQTNLNQHLDYMACLQSILQRSSDHEQLVDQFLDKVSKK